jgi:hypothetical protein
MRISALQYPGKFLECVVPRTNRTASWLPRAPNAPRHGQAAHGINHLASAQPFAELPGIDLAQWLPEGILRSC